jgi:ankyrin repeat protein
LEHPPDHEAVVSLLMAAGANMEAKNKWGLTPIEQAKKAGNRDMLELLRRHAGKK